MGEQCGKPACDIRATYTYERVYVGTVYRCTFHMAISISKIELANSELKTLQKVD